MNTKLKELLINFNNSNYNDYETNYFRIYRSLNSIVIKLNIEKNKKELKLVYNDSNYEILDSSVFDGNELIKGDEVDIEKVESTLTKYCNRFEVFKFLNEKFLANPRPKITPDKILKLIENFNKLNENSIT